MKRKLVKATIAVITFISFVVPTVVSAVTSRLIATTILQQQAI